MGRNRAEGAASGEAGRRLIAEGTPEQIAQHEGSYTGLILKPQLG
jgi:excinuclease UvrABC ATPase subunit